MSRVDREVDGLVIKDDNEVGCSIGFAAGEAERVTVVLFEVDDELNAEEEDKEAKEPVVEEEEEEEEEEDEDEEEELNDKGVSDRKSTEGSYPDSARDASIAIRS